MEKQTQLRKCLDQIIGLYVAAGRITKLFQEVKLILKAI